MAELFTKWTTFTHALLRAVPRSMTEGLSLAKCASPVDVERARTQWDDYAKALMKCGVKLISLPADDAYPDCCFVEDIAVVSGRTALVTRPGHESRREEVPEVRKVLLGLPLTLVEIEEGAYLDGGDVLFTGREVLVGLSARTNAKGVSSLVKAFPEFPVTGIPVDKNALHLKSCCTLAAPDTLLWGGSNSARSVLKNVQEKSAFKYTNVQLNGDVGANVVCANGHVIHRPRSSVSAKDYEVLKELFQNCHRLEVDIDEIYKKDGCLTCLSILINLPGSV